MNPVYLVQAVNHSHPPETSLFEIRLDENHIVPLRIRTELLTPPLSVVYYSSAFVM